MLRGDEPQHGRLRRAARRAPRVRGVPVDPHAAHDHGRRPFLTWLLTVDPPAAARGVGAARGHRWPTGRSVVGSASGADAAASRCACRRLSCEPVLLRRARRSRRRRGSGRPSVPGARRVRRRSSASSRFCSCDRRSDARRADDRAEPLEQPRRAAGARATASPRRRSAPRRAVFDVFGVLPARAAGRR